MSTLSHTDYDAAIVLPTPEGVEVEHPLGGVGSRSAAQLVDLVIESLLVAALTVGAYFALGGQAAAAVFTIALLGVLFFYDVLFEVYGSGATPGKRSVGLRVIELSGRPVGWRASSVRNAIRLIEGPLLLYFPALTAMVLSRRSQRLGDMAAGTVVIRDETAERVADAAQPPTWTSTSACAAGAIDTTAISEEELEAVLEFLARRDALAPAARERVARALAAALAPRVVGDPDVAGNPERLLAAIAAARQGRRGAVAQLP